MRRRDNRSGCIDLFWPGVLLVGQQSAGHGLGAAYDRAGGDFYAWAGPERPRYILVADHQAFELHDLGGRRLRAFGPADLERFLVRVAFCPLAADTGIFESRGLFTDYVESCTHWRGRTFSVPACGCGNFSGSA